ncbi:MAG: DNA cytosine methyltransferase [Chloroflexi bacterium]|nr:DNA cytosine methyltransferase [Chloroflexota bacterium]
MSIFSFFSGVGLLDLGFEDQGYEIALVNELHPPFLEGYKFARKRLNYANPEFGYFGNSVADFLDGEKKHVLEHAIVEVRAKGAFVGLIGGPPCPDFSIGGKNKGKDGENGILSQTYCDLICQFKPDFLLLENVKGLWKTRRHRMFYDELRQAFQLAGYLTTDRLINSIEYCVPQSRERGLLFGISATFARDHDLDIDASSNSIPDDKFDWSRHAKYPGKVAFQYAWPRVSKFEEDSTLPPPTNLPLELTVEYWFQKNDVVNHPNSTQQFKARAGLTRFLTIDEGDDSGKSFKRLHRWRYSPAAAYGHNEVHLHPYKPRRLSVSEAMAIQSLPKGFELPASMSLTDMFQAIGNGVPYLVSRSVAQTIREFLSNSSFAHPTQQKERVSNYECRGNRDLPVTVDKF